MHTRRHHLIFAGLLIAGNAAAHGPLTSRYTDLSGAECTKHIDDVTTRASTTDCPGVYGYRLLILEDDERTSVSILAPGRRLFPLQFWDVVTRGFSQLTGKAEWRIRSVGRDAVPVALIVRIDTSDQTAPEHPRRLPLLVVAKITSDTACVTHRVDATDREALRLARRLADSRDAVCLDNRPDLDQPGKG